jgi:hypothetical protein
MGVIVLLDFHPKGADNRPRIAHINLNSHFVLPTIVSCTPLRHLAHQRLLLPKNICLLIHPVILVVCQLHLKVVDNFCK